MGADGAPPESVHRVPVAARPWLRRSLVLAACGCIAIIVVLSWSPRGSIARTGAPGPLEHVIAYWGAGVVAALATSRRHHGWVATSLVALAGILEIGQLWIPGRTSQLIDVGASSLGAFGGVAFAAVAPSWRAGGGWQLAVFGSRGRRIAGVALIFLGMALTPVWIAFLLWFGLGLVTRMLG